MSEGPAGPALAVARQAARVVQPVWFPLAGAVTALGLIGSVQWFGLASLALIYVGSAGFGMLMLCAALADGGVYDVPVIRIGLGAALALVVLLGVLSIFPVAGWFVIATVAATCPLVTNRLAPPRIDRLTQIDVVFRQLVESLNQDESRDTEGT